jgi:predicted nucleic acid-binding protein
LDLGEASAIALALELENVLLILDDLKGRVEAEKLGFRITGTLGILFKAKKLGLIPELKPFIEKLKDVGFRISDKIEFEILRKSNEI